jgi:ATP-dependent protease ClpP protease subunit
MFKKLLCILGLTVLLLFGCAVIENPRHEKYDTSYGIGMLPDGTISIAGKIYEHSYAEFVRMTTTGEKEYTIRLNTFGGDALATVGILHHIKDMQRKGVKFTMIVQTKAMSAGAYMFMMGDKRIMYTGTSLMWHTIRGQFKKKKQDWSTVRGVVAANLDNFVVSEFERRFPHIDKVHINEWFWNTDMTFMGATEALLWGIATDVIY